MFPKPLTALEKENFVVNPVSNSAISLCASSTELTYPKLSACLPLSNGSRLKILAMLFLFVPQESWDLQLRMFGYITCGFPRIFGYVLQVIKYSTSVPLDRGGFGGWNLMLTTYYVGLVVAYNWNREKQMFVSLGKEFDMSRWIWLGMDLSLPALIFSDPSAPSQF